MDKSVLPLASQPIAQDQRPLSRAAIQLYLDEYTDTHYRLIILQQRRIIAKLERRIQCLQRKLPL
jgi:hypothetical protein